MLITGIIVGQMPVLLAVLFALSAVAQDMPVGSQACAVVTRRSSASTWQRAWRDRVGASVRAVSSSNFRRDSSRTRPREQLSCHAGKRFAPDVVRTSAGRRERCARSQVVYRVGQCREELCLCGGRLSVPGSGFVLLLTGRWDLSPGYAGKNNIELAKPIEEPCLYCHASRAQPVAKTQNGYLDPPFLEGGVGCERCHGSGQKHVKTHRDIVNPAKLDAARRDSICQQCHLTGAARVPRPGRGVGTFRPGDLLSDHLTVFVKEQASGERAATDHSEQLARSKCKLASGDRMWCGTCHDPHSRPAIGRPH